MNGGPEKLALVLRDDGVRDLVTDIQDGDYCIVLRFVPFSGKWIGLRVSKLGSNVFPFGFDTEPDH